MNITKIPANPKLVDFKKVGIYCRVSTKSEEQLRSLRAQISCLVQRCSWRYDYQLKDMYVDICSGDDRFTNRPEFSRMLTDVKMGKINFILTKSSQRFGRDTLTVLKAIRLLSAHGASAYFDTEKLDSADPMAEFILSIHASVNQAENETRGANIRWGIHRAVTSGRSKFYYTPCYGYCKKEDGELKIKEDEAEIVRRIYSWRLEGKSIPQIIASLYSEGIQSPTGKPKWCNGSVDGILTNRKYTGSASVFLTKDGDRRKATIKQKQRCCSEYRMSEANPAIISEEMFEQVQLMMTRRKKKESDGSRLEGV